MYLSLQNDCPNTYIFGTGKLHSLREFCDITFSYLDIPLSWEGSGKEELGVDKNGNIIVAVDNNFKRPKDSKYSKADFNKAYQELGWEPKLSFEEMVKIMVDYEKEVYEKSFQKTFKK